MIFKTYQLLVKHWLRMTTKGGESPHLRAVFIGDLISTEVITKGLYEKYPLDLLKNDVFPNLDNSKICLDVGANIGNHACFFSDFFDRTIAFEPNPIVCQLLRINAAGKNIDVVETGLSDKCGKLLFKQNPVNLGGSLIVDHEKEADFKIPVISLDDYLAEEELSNIEFMKIDAEGHELNVLKGALKMLETSKPMLVAEGFFELDPKLGEEIESLLRLAGYSCFYQLIPRHPLARWFHDHGFKLNRGLLSIILPEYIKRAVAFEQTDSIQGKDHKMFLAATVPLAG